MFKVFCLKMHIILFQPEIAQNTGNIGRLCAVIGARLHLIHPLGFTITDKHLRRSGMDYWYELDVVHHGSWKGFWGSPYRPQRIWLFTTKATRSYWDVAYAADDGLLFGSEGHGVPDEVHDSCEGMRVTIPQPRRAMRSLNLSTSVGIASYEMLRQLR